MFNDYSSDQTQFYDYSSDQTQFNPIPAGVLEHQDMLSGRGWGQIAPPPSKSVIFKINMKNYIVFESS